jgi:hypothetical protein
VENTPMVLNQKYKWGLDIKWPLDWFNKAIYYKGKNNFRKGSSPLIEKTEP